MKRPYSVQIWNELVLLMRHSGPEVSDPDVCLLGPPEVRLGYEDVAHGQHAKSTQLLGRVEHHRGEPAGHLGVEANLDPGLDLVLTLHQHVQQLLSVDHRLPEVCHKPNQGSVPFIDNLGEGGGSRGHKNLPDPVVEPRHSVLVHPEETLAGSLLGNLVLQVPDSVPVRELLVGGAHLRQDPALKTGHCKEKVGVVLGVDGGETLIPLDRGHRPWQSVLNVPEGGPTQIDIMLHQTHSGVSWPALLVVVADNVLIVRVRVFGEISLDEVPSFFGSESEEDVELVHVSGVQPARKLILDA